MPPQVITPGTLEKWDYVLRRLFVLKSTPLKRAIKSVLRPPSLQYCALIIAHLALLLLARVVFSSR